MQGYEIIPIWKRVLTVHLLCGIMNIEDDRANIVCGANLLSMLYVLDWRELFLLCSQLWGTGRSKAAYILVPGLVNGRGEWLCCLKSGFIG